MSAICAPKYGTIVILSLQGFTGTKKVNLFGPFMNRIDTLKHQQSGRIYRFFWARMPHLGPMGHYSVHILVNFMWRDAWSVHCLAEDARTRVSDYVTVRSNETLLRLFAASGATAEQLDQITVNMRRWGRGSVWIDGNETGLRLLRIRG